MKTIGIKVRGQRPSRNSFSDWKRALHFWTENVNFLSGLKPLILFLDWKRVFYCRNENVVFYFRTCRTETCRTESVYFHLRTVKVYFIFEWKRLCFLRSENVYFIFELKSSQTETLSNWKLVLSGWEVDPQTNITLTSATIAKHTVKLFIRCSPIHQKRDVILHT